MIHCIWQIDKNTCKLVVLLLAVAKAEPVAVLQVAFTPDGRHLVTANGTVYVLRSQKWAVTEK